jgi:type IV secretion system protein VirB3
MAEFAEQEPLKYVPIHRALNRPELFQFWGCDREMIVCAGLEVGICIFIGLSWFSAIFGVILWCFALFALRIMAKADPLLCHVYLRYRRYQRYYAAWPTPFVEYRQFSESRLRDPWKR